MTHVSPSLIIPYMHRSFLPIQAKGGICVVISIGAPSLPLNLVQGSFSLGGVAPPLLLWPNTLWSNECEMIGNPYLQGLKPLTPILPHLAGTQNLQPSHYIHRFGRLICQFLFLIEPPTAQLLLKFLVATVSDTTHL